jgi:magnesium chelatase family protein
VIAQAHSATLVGIDAVPVVVEVDLQGGIHGDGERYFVLVGLPDVAVRESKERVRTAIKNSALDITRTQSSTCAGACKSEVQTQAVEVTLKLRATCVGI